MTNAIENELMAHIYLSNSVANKDERERTTAED